MADESMTPEMERDVLAGEYALGLLEGEEAAAARRMVLADRDFAEQVRWWNHRLACMAEAAGSVEADEAVWPAIERRIGTAPDEAAPLRRRAAGGLSGAGLLAALGATAAAAAAITLFVASPRTVTVPGPVQTVAATPSEQYVAQLASEDGALTLAGIVDPQAGDLRLNIGGLQPGEGAAPELWVVPAGGAPQSLGRIPESGSFSRTLTQEERGLLVPGASLAVTYEASGSIPNTAPTTDILLLGGLTEV